MMLLAFALAWLAGLIGAALGGGSLWPGALAGGLGVTAGFLTGARTGTAAVALVCTALTLTAAAHYTQAKPSAEATGVALFNGGAQTSFAGVIVTEPEERGRSQRFQLKVEKAGDAAQMTPTNGKVLVTTRPFPRFQYGDRLTLNGKIETPPAFAAFDYGDFLARQGVRSVSSFPKITRTGGGGGSAIERALWAVRRPLAGALERALPEPEAALSEGMLLGLRSSIPRDLTDDFNKAGISHIVAISGYNVTLVAGLSLACLTWVAGRRRATVAAALVVVSFVLLVGPTPSVLRAGVMGIVALGATLAGRPGSVSTAIAASAAVLTALSPLAIDDVSFQLSFAATLGLVFLSIPIETLVEGALAHLLPRGLAAAGAGGIAVTLAATLASAPVIGATFGRVSLVAVPANIVAAPLVPLILATAALTAAGGAVFGPLETLLGNVADPPLRALILVGNIAASIPGASLTARFGIVSAAAMSLVVTGAALLVARLKRTESEPRQQLRLGPALTALALAFVALLSWWRFLAPNDGRLHVTFLDLGQAEATLVTTAAGQRILIDSGPSGPALLQALGRELGDKAPLELVVLREPKDGQITSLAELTSRYDVKAVLMSAGQSQTASYRAFRSALGGRGVRVEVATSEKWIDLGGGARLEVVGSPDLEETSSARPIVVRIVDGNVSFLLAGGLILEPGDVGVAYPLPATVLQLPRGASRGPLMPEFLNAVRPAIVTVSGPPVGGEAMDLAFAAELSGVPVFRREANGTVRFETDGRRLWADVDRGTFARHLAVPSPTGY